MFSPRVRRATALPIIPRPMMPAVAPQTELPMTRGHSPARSLALASVSFLARANMNPTARSATASEFKPGALTTLTPRSLAVFKSMLSTPMPCLAITFNERAECITAEVIGSRPVMMATVSSSRQASTSLSFAIPPGGVRTISRPPSRNNSKAALLYLPKVGVVIRIFFIDQSLPLAGMNLANHRRPEDVVQSLVHDLEHLGYFFQGILMCDQLAWDRKRLPGDTKTLAFIAILREKPTISPSTGSPKAFLPSACGKNRGTYCALGAHKGAFTMEAQWR